jgi:asparagine synthase (glutamine-hydrolysing)
VSKTQTKGCASTTLGNPAGLTALEIACAAMLGTDDREPLPTVRSGASLDVTVNDILEPALATGNCLVSFSGGRESAWLLAAATTAARSRGHADPVPATLRYPGASSASDALHQERIVSHLRLDDWERIEIGDELEILGPYAQRALLTVGLLFPATAYAMLPLLDRARGGWLLAGGALTDFFTYWRWARLSEVLGARRRPRRRDVRDLAIAALPRRRRARLVGARLGAPSPWLRPAAAAEAERLAIEAETNIPLRFDGALARQRTHRCHTGMRVSFDALAASAGARLALPFRDDRYIAALAAAGGRRGFGNRAATLSHLAGHLLPAELLRRSDGVSRNQAFFGDASRTFATQWSGDGVDDEVVDPEVLKTLWSEGSFPWASTMLLQSAFTFERAETARVQSEV